MAVDVSRIPNNNKFDPVREAILQLQTEIEDTGATIGNGTLTIGTSGSLSGSGTFTANQTSNTTITIGIDDSDYLSLSDTGEQTIAGDIVISGDLTVSGTTTYINTTNLNIGDNIITLNADLPSGTAPTENAGIEINRGSSTDVSFVWNETSDKWTLGSETLVAGTFEGLVIGNVTGDLTGNASTASTLATARNIAVDGAVTGNADFDGSGDITITTSVNHNHDDRYYTETESDNRFVNVDGDTMTDDLNFDSGSKVRLHSGSFADANDRYEIFATGEVMFLQYWDNDQGDGSTLQKVILSLDGTGSQREATLFGDLRLKSGNVASPTYDAVVLDLDAVNGHVDITNVRNGSFSGDLTADTVTATTTLTVGTTNVYDNLPTGITHSTTDNRLKIGVDTNGGGTTEHAIVEILLSDTLSDGVIPYVATGGEGSATVNSYVSDSWLKINLDTLELGASDPISHEIRYARFLWQAGSNDKISTVYGAKDITASIQYLGGSTTAKIEFTGGSGGGRIQFNDEYTFPATDGTSGQVLGTDGAGDLAWVSGAATTSDLQVVTDNGNTTTNSISIGKSTAPASTLDVDGQITSKDIVVDFNTGTLSHGVIFRGVSGSAGEVGIRANGEAFEIYEPEQADRVWLSIADDPLGNGIAAQLNSPDGFTPILTNYNKGSYITKAYIDGLGVDADTLDTKQATDFTLDYVTGNGDTTSNSISVGRNVNLSNADYTYIEGTHTGAVDGDWVVRMMGYADSTFMGSFDVGRSDADSGWLRLRQRINGTNTNVVDVTDGNVDFIVGNLTMSGGNIIFPATASRGIYFGGETSGTSYGYIREISDGQLEFGSDQLVQFYETDDNTLRVDWDLNSGSFNFIGTLKENNNNVIHAGNIGSQSVNYAAGAGSVGGYTADELLKSNTDDYTTGKLGIKISTPTAALEVFGTDGWATPSYFKHAYVQSQGRNLAVSGNESVIDVIGQGSGNHSASLMLRGANSGFGFVNDVTEGYLSLRYFTANADAFHIHGASGANVSTLNTIANFRTDGRIDLATNKYYESDSSYALNLQNSDIIGLNAMYFLDNAEASGEGINFYNSATTWDTLRASGGTLFFAPNRTSGSLDAGYAIIHAGNYTTYTDPKYLRSDTNDTTTGRLTIQTAGDPTIGGATPSNGYLYITDGAGGLGIDTNEIHTTSNLYIGTNSGNLGLRPSGAVLINTTATTGSAKLIVNGFLSANSSAAVQIDGFVRLKSNLLIHNGADTSKAGNILYDNDGYRFESEGTGSTSNARFTANLDVDGNLTVGDSHYIGNQTTFDNLLLQSSAGENIVLSSAADIYLSTGGTDAGSVGSTRLFVRNSDGRVGIGTIEPSQLLHLASTGSAKILLEADTDNVTETDNAGIIFSQDGGLVVGRVGFATNTNDIELINEYDANVFIGQNNSPNITVNATGFVGVNTTTPTTTFHANGDVVFGDAFFPAAVNTENIVNIMVGANASGQSNGIAFYESTNGFGMKIGYDGTGSGAANAIRIYNDSDNPFFTFQNGGNIGIGENSPSYALDVTGTIRATSDIIAFSDARVKENVKTIDNALDKVTQLRGVSYNKIGETEEKIGVIAQEIEKVLPQVVQEDDEGMKSVAYGNIVGVLIEAIKEQQKQIDELKAIINGGS